MRARGLGAGPEEAGLEEGAAGALREAALRSSPGAASLLHRLAPPAPRRRCPTAAACLCLQDALKDIIAVALELSQLKKFTGRDKPSVIT